MPSWIGCANGHTTKKVSAHDAAVSISEKRPIGVCEKCGKPFQYRIEHEYSNGSKTRKYSATVTRAVRLKTLAGSDEHYDAFLFVARDKETGAEQVLPVFWSYGQSNIQRSTQFPLLLSFQEWRTLFRRLDTSFDEIEERIRIRAYELYELRGRRHGHDFEDWLQAEAELRGKTGLLAAA